MSTEARRRARALREQMPPAEVRLWSRLKRLRERGYRFRRQHPLHGYILDFVCLDRMLAVEVDGGHHSDPAQAEHDAVRDLILHRSGFKVLRFWNSAVRTDIDWVMDQVVLALQARPSRFRSEGDEQGRVPDVTSPP